MDLDAVVDELYGIDPSEFTARRDALAAEARKAGDRELAAAVKGLRRPSAAAYTVNLMSRSRAAEIDRLIDLGDRMREAQEALSGDALRALGRQKQQVIAGLAHEARRAARDAGHPVSDSVGREVEATFEAALADPAAGEAVRQGRLVRALERSGMDPVDLTGAVAGPAGAQKAGSKTRRPGGTAGRQDPHRDCRAGDEAAGSEAKQAELARAREAGAEAEAQARQAEDRKAAAVAEHEAAQRRRAEADETVERIEAELAAARDEADRAAREEQEARRSRRSAEEASESAAAAARRARAELEALGG